jgi:hypothetical protein
MVDADLRLSTSICLRWAARGTSQSPGRSRPIAATDLRWDQIDFANANRHVRRVKSGTPSTHPLQGDEMRALPRPQKEQEPSSPFVFTSERGTPFTNAGFARMLERAAAEAKMAIKVHPHMLRHACGFALANAGHDTRALQAYLGTRTSSTRFDIRNWRRPGSRTSGNPDAALAVPVVLLGQLRAAIATDNGSDFNGSDFNRKAPSISTTPTGHKLDTAPSTINVSH